MCGNSDLVLLEVTAEVRNAFSLPFDVLGKYVHPVCIGITLCPWCKKHWVKDEACNCDNLRLPVITHHHSGDDIAIKEEY